MLVFCRRCFGNRASKCSQFPKISPAASMPAAAGASRLDVGLLRVSRTGAVGSSANAARSWGPQSMHMVRMDGCLSAWGGFVGARKERYVPGLALQVHNLGRAASMPRHHRPWSRQIARPFIGMIGIDKCRGALGLRRLRT